MSEAGTVDRRFRIVEASGLAGEATHRPLAIEVPVAIEYNGIGYAVMMATPIDFEDFGTGFTRSEGLIDDGTQILSIDAHEADHGWVMRIQLPADLMDRVTDRARQRLSESSCGLCGIETLEQVMRPLQPVTATLEVEPAAVFHALDGLRSHQPLNAATGAAHAAAFCRVDGSIVMVREDVGRHNALDKLLGALARADIAASGGFILLTARCSFELVQKAIIANCPLLVTISAPTSLAVEQAASHGLRLISLARPDSFLEA